MKQTDYLQTLTRYENTMHALGHAMSLINYDGATIAPQNSASVRPGTMAELSRIGYELTTSPETVEMLEALWETRATLSPIQARQVSELYRSYQRTKRIPKEEFVAFQALLAQSDAVWHTAKANNDFALFEPYLQQVFDTTVRMAGYENPDLPPYDATLDNYERGLNRETCDTFFSALRKKIVPLLERVKAAPQIDNTPITQSFPIEKQRGFSAYLMDVLGIDRASCILGETEHPFTDGVSNKDVRITTHYYENAMASSLYSVVHEGGHALYELGVADELQRTCLAGGTSMGIHESQSRFYENILGRSRTFCNLIFPYLSNAFPEQLAGVDAEQFYRMVNRVEPSLIRTEADELTYCLHVMVRYELEKAMFAGEIKAKDLPGEWNRLYREYLGIQVPDDRRGVLQDSHWSFGAIGYFPSYALGSAYGAQFLHEMEKDFDVYGALANGRIDQINDWNRTHIWTHGRMYDPSDLLQRICGGFSPDYYTDYLEKKYSDLYRL